MIGAKRQWDWKNASLNKEKSPVPEKKQKLTMSRPEKRNGQYVCLEYLESCLRGMREEKFGMWKKVQYKYKNKTEKPTTQPA